MLLKAKVEAIEAPIKLDKQSKVSASLADRAHPQMVHGVRTRFSGIIRAEMCLNLVALPRSYDPHPTTRRFNSTRHSTRRSQPHPAQHTPWCHSSARATLGPTGIRQNPTYQKKTQGLPATWHVILRAVQTTMHTDNKILCPDAYVIFCTDVAFMCCVLGCHKLSA